jgi:hypothetical protein
MNLCVCDREEREHGVGAGVNATMLSETLEVVGIVEAAGRPFWLRKKTMNLCVCDREECEHGDERE